MAPRKSECFDINSDKLCRRFKTAYESNGLDAVTDRFGLSRKRAAEVAQELGLRKSQEEKQKETEALVLKLHAEGERTSNMKFSGIANQTAKKILEAKGKKPNKPKTPPRIKLFPSSRLS